VLVVDDEELIVSSLSRTLRHDGLFVTGVGSAEEALRRIAVGGYDLCFLDLVLPGIDGLSALRSIKAEWPQTKVVLMTGSVLNRDDESVVAGLADGFLAKPFDLGHARSLARQILGPSGSC
jgi:CheY-like chemotaxis protein